MQLRDIPGVDSLYFTMLNSNKRAITLNPKTEAGIKIFSKLLEQCDVMVENYAPGAIDRMGFPWAKIQQINPRMIYASVKGFGPGPFESGPLAAGSLAVVVVSGGGAALWPLASWTKPSRCASRVA